MDEGFTMKFTGLEEVERRLQALPERVRKKTLRKTIAQATEIIRAEAERRCPHRKPVKPGSGWEAFVDRDLIHLHEAIASRVNVGKKSAFGRVGIDYKKVRHGHLVEFGHKWKTKSKSGITRKFPFMRPAFDAKGEEAVRLLIDDLLQAVMTEAEA
jgi:HK97 gp10 family phage protein